MVDAIATIREIPLTRRLTAEGESRLCNLEYGTSNPRSMNLFAKQSACEADSIARARSALVGFARAMQKVFK